MQIKVKNIGYWRNDQEARNYPVPIANSATPEEVIKMITNLNTFTSDKNTDCLLTKGASLCRVCGCSNGSTEYVSTRHANVTRVPGGLRHYIEAHKVLVPELLNLY